MQIMKAGNNSRAVEESFEATRQHDIVPAMNAQNSERLQEIFRAVFELSPGVQVTSLDQSNSPRWDSLDHVSLVTAIESEFGISLDAADQLRMTGYQAVIHLLEEKGL